MTITTTNDQSTSTLMTTEVLIIGAGPAGSACAISLQKAGVDCIVADKAAFPRFKLCGGLITQKGQDCLREVLGNDAYEQCMEVCVRGREQYFALWDECKRIVRVKLDNNIVLIDRPTMDNWLVQHYKSLGGRIMEGNGVKSIDFAAHVAVLESGEEVSYKKLVAADGVHSPVAHMLADADKRYKLNKKGCFCLEVFVDEKDCDIEDVNIHFNLVPNFYTWAFKKGNQVAIGLGKLTTDKIDIKEVLIDYMKRMGVRQGAEQASAPIRGAVIPSEVRQAEWKSADVLFAGDAGGFVELLTYEGIYYAIRSGSYAAQSIISGTSYTQLVRPMRRKMQYGSFFQKFIYWKPFLNIMCKYGSTHGAFIAKFYADNIDNIPSKPLWKQIAIVLMKTVRVAVKRK